MMLTESDSIKLRDLEGIIERGMQTFVEVGAALRLIREGRLYRTDFGTFEDYCQERWGWTPATETPPPWGDEDKWCWKLKGLYSQAPKRSQNNFRKWLLT